MLTIDRHSEASIPGHHDRATREAGVAARTSARLLASARSRRNAFTALANALQALAEVTDARAEICSIIARVLQADRVVLFEPEGDGITSTASSIVGEEPRHYRWADTSTAVTVFRTQQRVVVPDLGVRPVDAAHRATSLQLRELQITSAITQPVTRGRDTAAVLSVQFCQPTTRVRRRQAVLLETLAAGAASAIERVDLLARLAVNAGTDPLTGLANRRLWQQRVRIEVAAASRHEEPLTIAMIDIDHFKQFNDSYGHLAGDRVLVEVARALNSAVRISDLVARWGGEEFAVLLPACSIDTAAVIAERIMKVTRDPVTCSIGLAQWFVGEDSEHWLGRADAALLDAKAAGRARVHLDRCVVDPGATPTEPTVRPMPHHLELVEPTVRAERTAPAERRHPTERRRIGDRRRNT